MKKMVIFAIVCAVAVGLGAVSAQAITLNTTTNIAGQAVYLGEILPGIPPSLENQEIWLNALLGLGIGGSTTIGDETINRSLFACPSCAAPAFGGFKTDDLSATNNTIDLTGWDFVIAKYGGGQTAGNSLVWWVNLSGEHQVLGNYDGKDLSNVSRWKGTSVPDGGTTLMLLGGALLGLETLRRRFRA